MKLDGEFIARTLGFALAAICIIAAAEWIGTVLR
jgi:hypothetical protein